MSDCAPLVIGIGNRDRGDDAIGPLVADAIGRRYGTSTEIMIMEGDLSDLVVAWRPDQTVVIIDAMVSGRPPGTILEIDALAAEQICGPSSAAAPASEPALSTHGFGVAEAIKLAAMLDRLPRSLTVIAVEAGGFDLFAPTSDAVAASVDAIAARIAGLLQVDPADLPATEGDQQLDGTVGGE